MWAISVSGGWEMISMRDFNKIRELSKEGLKPLEIASKLNINRKTVAKYLASNSPPQYPKERAQTLLKSPNLSNVEIYEMLKEEGYQGSERTVQRRLHEINIRWRSIPAARFASLPNRS
jgi:transposase